MITNPGSSRKPSIFFLDARNPTGINLTGLARKFDSEKGDTATTVFEKLMELSEKLCDELDSKYQSLNDHDEKSVSMSYENLCWAASSILSCWLGLTLKSKFIPNAELNPDDEHHLYFDVIPSVLNAFKQGIEQAISDKKLVGNPTK